MAPNTGIGAKFKTSTWGILGFLLFKSLATVNGYDERRTRWCVQKIKKQLDIKRAYINEEQKKKIKVEEDRANKTINAIEKLCNTMEREISSNRNVLEQNQAILDKKLKESEQIAKAMKTISEIVQKESLLNENRSNKTIKAIEHIGNGMDNLTTTIGTFVDKNDENLETMLTTSNKMANAAENIGKSADNLQEATVGLKTEIGSVLNSLDQNLEKTISAMSQNLENATKEISEAVGTMSKQVKEIIDTISKETKEATNLQQKAFGIFETTSQTLNEQIAGMTNLIEQLKQDIISGLDAVSDKRQQTIKAMSTIETTAHSLIEMSKEISELKTIFSVFTEQGQKINEQILPIEKHSIDLLEKIVVNTTPTVNKP